GGGAGDGDDDPAVDPAGSSTTTTVDTTTTSARTDSTPAGGDTSPRAPLTGEPLGGTVPDDAALVVKIGNNDDRARPQAGLVEADIVFEELIEGQKTRFAAVFHSEVPERIGPVRSGRSGDIDLLADLGRPLLAYSGGNSTVLHELSAAESAGVFVDVGFLRVEAPYSRDGARAAPDNLYFDPSELPDADAQLGPVPLFTYGASVRSEPGAVGVTVRYPSSAGRESTHIWDRRIGGWVRIQDGTLHLAEVDDDLVEIAPTNVVVLSVDYRQSAADAASPQAVSFGDGEALVLTRGAIVEGTWHRRTDTVGYLLEDRRGELIELAPGATWVLLANTGAQRFSAAEVVVLDSTQGESLLAEAREISASNGNAGT
ncbi:MAG: DUF3048 domain-containing protein, partial [Acidimicrobiales bacterium]